MHHRIIHLKREREKQDNSLQSVRSHSMCGNCNVTTIKQKFILFLIHLFSSSSSFNTFVIQHIFYTIEWNDFFFVELNILILILRHQNSIIKLSKRWKIELGLPSFSEYKRVHFDFSIPNEVDQIISWIDVCCVCCSLERNTCATCTQFNSRVNERVSRIEWEVLVGVYKRCNKTNHIWLQSYWSVKFVGLPINFVHVLAHALALSVDFFVFIWNSTLFPFQCESVLFLKSLCGSYSLHSNICFVDFSISIQCGFSGRRYRFKLLQKV